jgi:hypothetical protein
MPIGRIETTTIPWQDVSEYAREYFEFWPDAEDFLWFKGCWGALQRGGLCFVATDEDRVRTLSQVPLLAFAYQEFCWRLGHNLKGLTAKDFLDTSFDAELAELDAQLAKVHTVLLAAFGEERFFAYTLRSVVQGSNDPLPFNVVDELVQELTDGLPFGGEDSTRDAYLFLARGFKSSRGYRVFRSFQQNNMQR